MSIHEDTPGAHDVSVARLRVDWPACRARGLCAEVLPEAVSVDRWGYPVITGEIPRHLRALAQEAAAACPYRALHLVPLPLKPS